MLRINDKIISFVVVAVLFLAGTVFVYTVFRVIHPWFFEERQERTSPSLDKALDEVAGYLLQREDLTESSPSARLIEGSTSEITAEIINASGVPFAAKNLGEALETLGLAVSQLGNSQAESEETIISFKDKALFLKDRVSEKVGSRSGGVSVSRLDDTYPYDIRVVIGR